PAEATRAAGVVSASTLPLCSTTTRSASTTSSQRCVAHSTATPRSLRMVSISASRSLRLCGSSPSRSAEDELGGVRRRAALQRDHLGGPGGGGQVVPGVAGADPGEGGAWGGGAEAQDRQAVGHRRAVAVEVEDNVALGLPGMEDEGVVARAAD